MTQTSGNLFILSAPSGAGKSSLIKALLAKHADSSMQVSVSHTTRNPRPGEVDGEHYHFVSKDSFKALIEQDAFFEWAETFGNYYGTSHHAISQLLADGIDVFLDIEWQGARQVKELMPEAVTIFIAPPSRQELLNRLTGRKQDSEQVIAQRMDEAVSEISHYNEFDFIIVNDDFDTALNDLTTVVLSHRLKKDKQTKKYQLLFKELLTN